MSFKDSNDDGYGDLRGVIQKLDYLEWLGVDYLWISPFYKTPFKDNGYDVSDYLSVDDRFGTKNDFLDLLKKSKKRNIKIIMDLVFNHTSTEHIWFKKWINGESEYKDFYISKYSNNKPPNNWKSKFGGSAWKEYKKDNWYLCLFDKTQADLNWENPNVRKKLYEVIKYYVDLGVQGFRFDVINLISKTQYKNDYISYGKKYYTNGYKFHKFLEEIRTHLPKNNQFLSIAELSSTDIKNTIQSTNQKKTELDCAFIFCHLKIDYKNNDKFAYKEPNMKKFNKTLARWFSKCYEKGSLVGFLNNHDQPRSVSRFIKKEYHQIGSKMLFALISLLPGHTCIYQGEEIAMTNGDFANITDFLDIETVNYLKANNYVKIPKGVLQKSRDNSRTPMQWNNDIYSGFSKLLPWIKVNQNYANKNVFKQKQDPDSTLNFYKEFIDFLKKDDVLNYGSLFFHRFRKNIISYSRIWNNTKYHCLFNLSSKNVKYNFNGEVMKSNYNQCISNMIKPYQFLVIRK